MKRPAIFHFSFVSFILVVYCVLLMTGWLPTLVGILFFLSPFLVTGMVYGVLRFDTYQGKELNEDEWGYADKKKDELNMF